MLYLEYLTGDPVSRSYEERMELYGSIVVDYPHYGGCVLRGRHCIRDKEVEEVSIGESIRTRRLEKGLTQAELAKRVSVSGPMIAQIERGTKAPSLPLAAAITKVLGCSLDDLYASSLSPMKGGTP